jgi:integrase
MNYGAAPITSPWIILAIPLPLEGLAGTQAGIGFDVQIHMLRHACDYALALDARRLQHYLGHASITNMVRYSVMSPEPFRDIWR